MRIGFFGTPSLARSVLHDLIQDDRIEVAFVVTNPDAPVGRERIMTPSPVKTRALEAHIPVFTPTKLRNNTELHETLRSYNCDYFVVVAYGRIMPSILLEMPKKLAVNIHGSLLPKYRGASPIQSALLFGEEETGVTIMKMSEGMDEGDILRMFPIPIEKNETAGSLFIKFGTLSGKSLIETLCAYENGEIVPRPQDHEKATYCKKIEKEDGKIDFTKSAKEIYHMWQAYTPWPGIYTFYEGKRLLLENIGYSENTLETTLGKVVKLENEDIGIVCKNGILTLERVKLEGKKSQTIQDFVNGQKEFIGCTLLT